MMKALYPPRTNTIPWTAPESWSCDETIRADVLAALEDEFGPMTYPLPNAPVFHQGLGSDAERRPYRPSAEVQSASPTTGEKT